MKNQKKGFLQISFQWIFAIIVGIVILFLAIYGVTRLINTGQRTQDIESSKEIEILLNPLETGFEEAKSSFIEFDRSTRVYFTCDDFGEFGTQGIDLSQKSFGKWSERSNRVTFYNKYIFSENPIESEKINLFSKPFEFPFKIGDLIYVTSENENYCFIDAPEDIQQEIENLNMNNLLLEDCSDLGYTNVCFSGECDIEINYNSGYLKKQERFDFEGDALMYAAIFSSKSVYECQVKRLMKRTANLAEIYKGKSNLIKSSGCNTFLNPDLEILINSAKALEESSDLHFIKGVVEDIDMKNKNNQLCRLW